MPTALFLVDCQTEEALIGDPAYNAGTKDASSLYLKAKRSYLRDPHTPLNGQGLLPAEVLRRFHLELYRTATSAVRELSFQATTNHVLSGPKGKLFELSLTQDEFRELTVPLHQTLAHAVTDTLAGSELNWDQIDTCLLVGGGSLICGVRETVAQAVGRAVEEIHVSSCPLEVVARGAALFAALDGQRQGDPLPGGLGFLLSERSAGVERTVAKMHVSAGGSVIPRGGLTVESTRQYVEATGGPLVLNVEFVEARPGIQCPVPEGGVAYLEPEQVESIGSASIDISDLPAGTHECLFGFDVDRSGRLGFRLFFLGQVGQEVRCGTIGADATGSHAIGRHMAVAVVLDISGSMREVSPSTDNAKLTDAQAAICELARHAGGYENVDVALVAFNDAAQVVVPFGHPPDRIDAAVAAMQAHGGTHMQTGLAAAAELLAAYPHSRRMVIFVTDGRPASAAAAVEEAARLREHGGIEIVCIAIGDDALVPFLAAQIASDPTGVHAGQDINELFTTVKQTHLFTQDTDDEDTDGEDTDGET